MPMSEHHRSPVGVYITFTAKRLDELCTTCWKSGLVSLTITQLTDTGVKVGAARTFCALCQIEG